MSKFAFTTEEIEKMGFDGGDSISLFDLFKEALGLSDEEVEQMAKEIAKNLSGESDELQPNTKTNTDTNS